MPDSQDLPVLTISFGLQPRPTEKGMLIIHLHMKGQEFEDESEAHAFSQRFLGTPPQPPGELSPEEGAQLLSYNVFQG